MDNYQLAHTRLAFIEQTLGVTFADENKCIQDIMNYGYREIFGQYIDHYLIGKIFNPFKNEGKLKRPTSFEEIFAFYQLDQKLKNELMIDLQHFEQTFRSALDAVVEMELTQIQMKQIKVGEQPHSVELLKEGYQMQSGRVIHRGDVKARIRHIKQNYLEPVPGYTKMHGGITPWVLFKEMSFGIVTNYFFLMPDKMQKRILQEVFKEDFNVPFFEHYLSLINNFRHRAAHNYRLLGIKVKGHYLYPNVIAALSLLKNQEPYQKAKEGISRIGHEYLRKYPNESKYLNQVLFS